MIKVFLFHRVNPQRNVLWDPMSIPLFDRCIEYISRNYEVMLIEDVAKNLSVAKSKKIASIVFDDGYKDNIEYALPILEKYRVKASFYVVTECIDKNIPTWTFILDHLFENTSKSELSIDHKFIPPSCHTTKLKTREERIQFVKKLKPVLKKIKHLEREQVLDKVSKTFDDVELPKIMMSWNDLQQISSAGHVIGSHTVNHFMLGTIEDENIVFDELIKSGKRIEEKLGHFPDAISYPVGSYNSSTVRLSKTAGYRMGLAVKQMAYNPLIHDVFEIPRIELYNESWIKTRFRISDLHRRFAKLLK